MIRVKCLGHIGTSVGAKEVEVSDDEISAADLLKRLRGLSREADPGFDEFNTIVMVEDGDAFVPAGGGRTLRSGEKVVLIPFSHGG